MSKNPVHQRGKRRTTLSLPAESLDQAAKIARAKHLNLSTVISEALTEGLRQQVAKGRCDEVLDAYKKAFQGFSEDELAILDGVILEPVRKSARKR